MAEKRLERQQGIVVNRDYCSAVLGTYAGICDVLGNSLLAMSLGQYEDDNN